MLGSTDLASVANVKIHNSNICVALDPMEKVDAWLHSAISGVHIQLSPGPLDTQNISVHSFTYSILSQIDCYYIVAWVFKCLNTKF